MKRWILVLFLLITTGPAQAEDAAPQWPWVYPGGISTQSIGGLQVTLYVPRRLTPRSGSSLLVLLHGARAQGARLATFFGYWPRLNYVVCAPQATGPVWTPGDLTRVRNIVHALRKALPMHPDKLHVAGFSNGASNLASVAFADDMRARSGTWVGGGFAGGTVPAWAQTRFGALFMSGERDFALERVRQSPARLQGRVRSVELHVEPDIGHTWPSSQIEYHAWWMGVQEGRFTPGEDVNFDYEDELAPVLAEVTRREARGAFVYVYDPIADAKSPTSRALQHVTLMDPVVRRRGNRLQAVRMDRATFVAQHPTLPIPATPAIVVFDQAARPIQTLSGAISVEALRAALLPVTGD